MFRLQVLLNIIIIAGFLWATRGQSHNTTSTVNDFGTTNLTTTNSTNSTNSTTSTPSSAMTAFLMHKQEETFRAAKSKEILGYMNLSANPCDDFYEFTCGNWNKYHTPTNKNESETPDTLLDNKINKDLHRLLDENVTIDDTTPARKVKMFYKSCLEAKRDEEHHQIFLKDFIKSNGGFPAAPGSNWLAHTHNYDWQHIVAGLRYNYGMEILIGMDIDINYQNTHENSIYLMEPSTLIPRHLCNYKSTVRVEVTDIEYDSIEQEVADNLKLWLSLKTEDSLKLAADIVTFEYDLCTAMYVEDSQDQEEFMGSTLPDNLHRKYTRNSLLELNHLYNDTIDFNILVRDSFGLPMYKPVFMKSPKYYETLVRVIEEYNEYNKMVLPNYIMYRAMSYINLPLNDTPQNRPAYCLQVVKKYLPKILGDMYHRKYANSADQAEAEYVFGKLKKEYYEALRQDWIEESTARLGKVKLSEVQLQFPTYDQSTLNLEFVRSDFWKNLKLIMGYVRGNDLNRIFATGAVLPKEEVEAYETRVIYRPHHKRIDVGWGILQQPYYHPQLPKTMRFAALGQKLGQALATVFDDYSWMADINGLNNWDTRTAMEYYRRANCFRQQIGNYLDNQSIQSFSYAAKTREIIAKRAGLNRAFNAYIDWLLYQHPINDQNFLYKETLPGLDFTNTQLFFITFAQMQCKGQHKSKKSDNREVLISPLINHSITRYEVNGPLGNFEEFGREFHCPLGSEMNVPDKCVIY